MFGKAKEPDGDEGKGGSLLLALGGKPMGEGEPDGDEDMGGDMKMTAANDAFDAVKSGDRALFADALDRYVKACMSEE